MDGGPRQKSTWIRIVDVPFYDLIAYHGVTEEAEELIHSVEEIEI